MSIWVDDIRELITGDVDDEVLTRKIFSHDASMFEMVPEAVVAPKNVNDIEKLVRFVSENKYKYPALSLTVRSGGTCMSGGAINDSIIIDIQKYFNKIGEVTSKTANTQPGVLYRDFEKETLKKGALMPSFPASRDICTVGGMLANNAGGEKSLEFGKVEKYVKQLKVVFADGNEYIVKPITRVELIKKMAQDNFEGKIYKEVFELIENNYDEIKAAKPAISKDSTGYHLWDVWDREKGIFDLTQLIVGSQGTLGIVTDITFNLVPKRKYSGTLVIFLHTLEDLGEMIVDVMKHKPATFEGFDSYTLALSVRLFFNFRKTIGLKNTVDLAFRLIPSAFKIVQGVPKMVLLVEFDGDNEQDVANRVHAMRLDLAKYKHEAVFEEDETAKKAQKFWIMRHESFNLLRQKVKDKHTAPFMDDLIVPPAVLPKFLPEIRQIINKYKFFATIAGHFGDGNFHIIPLMNIEKKSEKAKLEPAMKEITKLVLKYDGSLSGEHNDGMIRGPWLKEMYGEKIFGYFKEVKNIFDKDNIFNPHKKTDANWKFSMRHLREKF
jgi:FAD/FMN-containing dehydrogenase